MECEVSYQLKEGNGDNPNLACVLEVEPGIVLEFEVTNDLSISKNEPRDGGIGCHKYDFSALEEMASFYIDDLEEAL